MTRFLSARVRAFRARDLLGILAVLFLGIAATASAAITYEYDNAGRLRKVTYDDGMVVTYTLDAAGNRTTVTKAQAGGSIQFSAATYSVGEGTASVTITAARVGGTTGAVGVSYATSNGSATAGSDYTAASGTLSWASGDSANKTFTIAITNDTAVESNETVIALTAPTGGAALGSPVAAVLTITDNDVAVPGAIRFSAATYSVGEAGPTVTITAQRTGGTSGAVGISYATSNGTATAGSDYIATSGTLSWANGDSANKTFTVAITNDTAVESSETINLTLSLPTGGATLGSPSTAVLTITDNDVAGAIQFSGSTYSVGEAGPTVTITATRTGGTAGAVGISYATSNGTATAGSDYTATSGTLSWANGDSANKTFTVAITNDTAVESSETVNLALSAPTGGATLGSPSSAVLTIVDNDTAPVGTLQFSASTYSVGEGGSSVTITASRTGGSAGAVGVSYATSNGTATAGSDYTAASGTLSWANGDTANKTFTIPILEDSSVEGSETVNVTLSSPTGSASLGSPSAAVLTITDNDNPPAGSIQFTASSTSVSEAGSTVTITASRTGGSFGAIGASYATSNGSAASGSDYTAASGTLSWANGDTANKTFTIPILEDSSVEGSETVNVTLSSPTGGASLGSPSAAVLTITDNDNPPAGSIQFTASSTSVGEAGSTVTITASRTGGSFGAIGASYATSNGSAASGSDYTAASGTLSWANGDTANKSFTVTILDDSTLESAESFTAALSAPTGGGTIGSPSTISVTINENDAGPVFSIASVTPAENAGSVTLTVTKSGNTTLSHSVNYSSANGTAVSGADYTGLSNTLTFAPGDSSLTFSLPILDDSIYEQNETFYVSLSGPTNGASVSVGATTATVTINDNDASATFSIANVSVGEGATSVTFTVTKSGSTALTHAVSYATANGMATAGSDYTATSGTLTFASGTTSQTFTVTLLPDATFEGNETFTASLSSATNGSSISTGTATATIIDDDPNVTITISDMSVFAEGVGINVLYFLDPNGDIIISDALGTRDVGDWLSPKTGMSSYEFFATPNSVTQCSGAVSAWRGMTSVSPNTPAWSVVTTGDDQYRVCDLTLQIRAIANPSVILDTAHIVVEAISGL